MDLKGIPEKDFKRLAHFLGDEGAYEFIKKNKFSYNDVVMKIIRLELSTFLRSKPIYYTIIFIIAAIIFFLLMFPDLFFF